MIYEEEGIAINASHATDSRLQTAAHYLKALHWFDRPTDLMPIDGKWLKAARRFYNALTAADKDTIDSYSDDELYHSMNLRQRDKRFNTLCRMFLETLEPVREKEIYK